MSEKNGRKPSRIRRTWLAGAAITGTASVLLLSGCTLRGTDFCVTKAPEGSFDEFIQFFACESDEYGQVQGPFARLSIAENPTRSGTPVTFDATGSSGSYITRNHPLLPPVGSAEVVNYRWDLDGDRSNGFEVDTGETPTVQRSYEQIPGQERRVEVGVQVTDAAGLHDDESATLIVREPDDAAAPIASFTYSPSSPVAGDTVRFDASASSDPNGDQLTYSWDLDGDTFYETPTGTTPTVERTYTQPQQLTIGLLVSDGALTSETTRTMTVREFGPGRREGRRAGPQGSPSGYILPNALAKRGGRRFRARITAAEVSDSGTGLERVGDVLEARDVEAKGGLAFRFRDRRGHRRSLSTAWTARLDLSLDLSRDERRASGPAILRLPGIGRSCVRLSIRSKGDRLLGGFKVAGRKGAGGAFRAKIGAGRISGSLRGGPGGGRIAKPCRDLVP